MEVGLPPGEVTMVDDLLARLRQGFVETEVTAEIHRHLGELVSSTAVATSPISPNRFPLVVIQGPAGCGKRRVVKEFVERYCWEGNTYLWLDLTVHPTTKDLVRLFLEALDEPAARLFAERDGSDTQRIETLLGHRQVKIIAIANFDELVGPESSSRQRDVLRWLDRLLRRSGVPVIVVGGEGLRDKLKVAPSLHAAIGRCFTMRAYDWEVDQAAFRLVLRNFERLLDLPSRSGLEEFDLAFRLHQNTEGVLGSVVRLLEAALRTKVRSGQPIDRITETDLHHAAAWLGVNPPDPFRKAA